MGAGGRDFHNFNTVFRDDEGVEVVAFTATQIPGIDQRTYPAVLAGERYADGIPIRPEADLADLVATHAVDEVVLAYSDLSDAQVMHRASVVLAAGADFSLLGPNATMLRSTRPVVAVCAVRTGSGKSQTSRRVCRLLRDAGWHPVLVRHPMPYGDLTTMAVQRFASQADIDAAAPTIEEREEYETPVRDGLVVYAGVDYAAILADVEAEADVIVWDGGNNDTSFFRPDLTITVVDPLRAGDETGYYPGEVNLLLADVVVVNKVDSAPPDVVDRVVESVHRTNPTAMIVRAASPVTLAGDTSLAGRRVLVVEDGPTITHGGMPFGAGTVAARQAGATALVDPRPFAVGSVADAFRLYPHIGPVLPAMGYSQAQVRDLEATIDATDCDLVVNGSPVRLDRLVQVRAPIRQATYELREIGRPDLADVLAPFLERWPSGSR